MLPMLKLNSKGFIRLFSSSYRCQNRPELLSILPKKSALNKLLFDIDSRLPYKKVLPIYEAVYKSLDDESVLLPHYTTGSDLMILRNVLQNIRKQSKMVNRHLVEIENELVEKAAELGDNDAICILAFETLHDTNSSLNDKRYAKKLIIELEDLKHPLVYKLSGDYAFQLKNFNQAEKFYHDFLAIEKNMNQNSQLISEVYKTLGYIKFQQKHLIQSKEYFDKSIRFGTIDKNYESHFYLGQLNHSDTLLSRYHLELAASKGLKESFSSLGLIEMKQFNNPEKAKEWFKLGIEINDFESLLGGFDCFIRLEDYISAKKVLVKLYKIDDKKLKGIIDAFLSQRKDYLKLLEGS